jgi:hypothetical protein
MAAIQAFWQLWKRVRAINLYRADSSISSLHGILSFISVTWNNSKIGV